MKELQARARELLASGEVAAVIGYAAGTVAGRSTPVIITKPADASSLILDASCVNNLAVYLLRPEVRRLGKVAVVAREAAIRAIFVLMQENQLAADGVVIIGVAIPSPGDIPAEPRLLPGRTRDELLEHLKRAAVPRPDAPAEDETGRMSDAERWDYWRRQFAACIRCYACRQVCPMCYCSRCIVEKSRPQWIETSPHERGNFAWNITRAFHLAGRCVECGECERACPAGLPLMKLNRVLARHVREKFDYVAGTSFEGEALFTGFRPDDPDDFTR